jgi:hypothetical protein
MVIQGKPSLISWQRVLTCFFPRLIGLGLCSGYTSLDAMPGWNPSSWGYHGDDGHIFDSSGTGKPYGDIFGTGDVVGCCLTCDNEIYFTKNGISHGKKSVDILLAICKLIPRSRERDEGHSRETIPCYRYGKSWRLYSSKFRP